MIKVIIADNQILTREGIIAILTAVKDIDIVGIVATGVELEQLIIKNKPDVILMDENFTADLNIYKKLTGSRLLILSNNQSKEAILEVINGGIKNYIFKQCSRDEVIQAIYATAKGEQFFCENTLRSILGDRPENQGDENPQLSLREEEIVQLIAAGMTNKEIADKLFLSIHTIKTHRKNIIKKLGFTFKNAADLMIYARKTSHV
jgi:two-component system NarL family response regulator